MPYLIDGHNLIGSMPDIHLDDPEDEMQLIRRLGDFFKRRNKSGTVYFDQRGPGSQRKFKAGRIMVEFASSPNTADMAIQKQLQRLKGEASNYIVVSSDHQVKQAAREAGARILDSHKFARELGEPSLSSEGNEKPDGLLSLDEINHWQIVFKNSKKSE